MNQYIEKTLEHLGVPVKFQYYEGKAETYITYFEMSNYAAINADDEEIDSVRLFHIDIFSKGNYMELVKQVKQAMKQAGFGKTFETERYIDETKQFQKVLRFSYVTENEEE